MKVQTLPELFCRKAISVHQTGPSDVSITMLYKLVSFCIHCFSPPPPPPSVTLTGLTAVKSETYFRIHRSREFLHKGHWMYDIKSQLKNIHKPAELIKMSHPDVAFKYNFIDKYIVQGQHAAAFTLTFT